MIFLLIVLGSISTSYISFEQANLNLARELNNKSFDMIKNECRASWEEYLDKIDIDTAVEKLIKRACENGGHDNITVALIKEEL